MIKILQEIDKIPVAHIKPCTLRKVPGSRHARRPVSYTPPEIVSKLNAAFWKAFQTLNAQEGFTFRKANTPEEFAAFLKSENARWGKFIKEEGIRVE